MELLEFSVAAFVLTVLTLLVWLLLSSRELAEAGRRCDAAFSNVERLLGRRDEALAPFLGVCDQVLGAAGDASAALAELRAAAVPGGPAEERARRSTEVSTALRVVIEAALRLRALPEGFPEQKARLEEIEEQLAHWSEIYDGAARGWNHRLERLPESLVARLERARPRPTWREHAA